MAAIALNASLSVSSSRFSIQGGRCRIAYRNRVRCAAGSSSQESEASASSSVVGLPEASIGIALAGGGEEQQEVAPGEIGPGMEEIYSQCKVWEWKGLYKINYVALVSSGGPAILLVHGFGASIGHFRRNIPVLAKNYSVYAIDLLGLGASEKPANFSYTMETWGELLLDFIKDVMESAPTVLVGNSIGSLACLTATANATEGLIRGAVLLNCAGGMNNKAVVDDWRLKLASPLLSLIDWLLKQPGISSRLFNRVKSRENLKTLLSSVYVNKEAVDQELIEIIRRPAEDPGALEAFVSIITGPPGPTPMALIDKIHCPILVLWGDTDPFTPVDGPVGKYFTSLPSSRPNVKLRVLQNVGHCPHDDEPELVHEQLLPWLASLSS
ncbi:uncharacterized protein LOC9662179 [Selaginella moellendorffii]|nr:uncharacterized protein LOC9662179 [Selaginella moellendorffii]|eukprot:XP_002962489.2 uncharacterized protein LOC9662179 [Selaginella moellendorffii]